MSLFNKYTMMRHFYIFEIVLANIDTNGKTDLSSPVAIVDNPMFDVLGLVRSSRCILGVAHDSHVSTSSYTYMYAAISLRK